MRRIILFVNPLLASRRGRRSIVARCALLLREHGCSVELCDTLPGGDASQQSREAVESGFDTVFVLGGDGTTFHILQGIAGSEAALGVIPLGTGNVLVQNLCLTRDPVAALLAQKSAVPVSIPLGEVTCFDPDGRERGWHFAFAAGVGMHAALMNFNGYGKWRWGRAAYYGGGLRLLATQAVQPFEVDLTAPSGETRHFRAAELLAVRVPTINRWRAGGDLLSSQLRVASIAETGRLGLAFACFHAVVTGSSTRQDRSRLGLPYPRYEEATQVTCDPLSELASRAPLVEADGEVIGAGRAVFRVSDKRLKLLWPRAT